MGCLGNPHQTTTTATIANWLQANKNVQFRKNAIPICQASVPVLYLSFMRNALIKECFLKSYLHEDVETRRDVSLLWKKNIVAKVLEFILN